MAALRNARLTAILATVAFSLSGCNGAFGERVHETVHERVAAQPAAHVRVDNVAGTVRIAAWSKPSVAVEATKYGHDPQELRSIAIAVEPVPGGVSVQSRYSTGVHGGGVRYRIDVPAGASVRVDNVAGTVDVDGVRGDVEVATQAGAINVNAGRVEGNRAIDLHATTGAIKLTIAPGSSAKVEALSTVGAFNTDIEGLATRRENFMGARGSGTLGSGSARISLTTTTGAIALRQR